MGIRHLTSRVALVAAIGLLAACTLARPGAIPGTTGTEAGGTRTGTESAGTQARPTGGDAVPRPTMRIAGRVTVGGQAAAGATVTAYPELARPDGASYRTVADPDGSFALDVPAGTYNLVARGPGARQAIRFHVQAATQVDLDLVPVGGIRGSVTASPSADLTGAEVFVPGTDFVAKTDASGSYSFFQVPSATYDLVAQVPGYALARVTGVAVPAGGTATAPALIVSPLAAVMGTLTGLALLDGAANSSGIAIAASGNGATATASTTASGSYSLVGLPVSIVQLTYAAAGYATVSKEVTVPAGDTGLANVWLYPIATPTPAPTPVPTPTPVPPTIAAWIGGLAPDDTASASLTHDYQVTVNSVTSTFVWIPVFTAYQIINPAAAGCGTCAVGHWRKDRPSSGVQNTDWAAETFGGFYAGKFEASHADASPGDPVTSNGATRGSSSTLKVARYCVPWTDVTWDQAAAAAASFYEPYSHLMRDDEWTALAVWAMINGKAVYGNNAQTNSSTSYPKISDVDSSDVSFTDDPVYSWSASGMDRALTGSATSSLWAAGVDKTTHTGTTGGVHDLNGNVWEWTLNVGAAITSGNYTLFDAATLGTVDLGFSVGPTSGSQVISGLSTDPRWRRFGLPGATNGAGDPFGNDNLWKNTSQNDKSARGGLWYDGSSAGVWSLSLGSARSIVSGSVGFRPVLVF